MKAARFILMVYTLLLALFSPVQAKASANENTTASINDIHEQYTEQLSEGAGNSLLPPKELPLYTLDEEGKKVMQGSFKAYYQYRTNGFDHRQRVFEWQLFSSKVIFAVVTFLVWTGIYFSWLQFKIDLNKKPDEKGDQKNSTIEASTSGIKVSSPVLGVIILVISLLFFYLYLQHVYPIEEIL